jgi:hypothetical protein
MKERSGDNSPQTDGRPAPAFYPCMSTSPAITRFVLMNTSHPGNVGAAALAIQVMGFDELVLAAARRRCARPS